jgi:hypothetical protein
LGNRREKVGRWFQEENDDVWEHDLDVCSRDVGMEGTGGGEKSARKYLRWVLGVDRETPGYIVRESARGTGWERK